MGGNAASESAAAATRTFTRDTFTRDTFTQGGGADRMGDASMGFGSASGNSSNSSNSSSRGGGLSPFTPVLTVGLEARMGEPTGGLPAAVGVDIRELAHVGQDLAHSIIDRSPSPTAYVI